jgi:archaetidylinositol phosphate synthase
LAGFILVFGVSDELTYVVAPCLILVSGFFDAIDGSLARLYGSVTKFGGVLDSTIDRFGEILVLSSIVIVGLSDAFWGLAAIACSTMVSYVRARVEVEGVKMSGVGFAERPERMLILAAGLFLRSTECGVILVAIFSGITVAQRILYAYRHLG